jgi:hypothetical protein
MTTHELIGFSTALDDEDYGIIVNKEGRVKGIWVPRGKEEELIPVAVVDLCMTNFGIDPNSGEKVSSTVH